MSQSESLGLDFLADETLSGFRLSRLEVFNWGTFNAKIWSFTPNGRNVLLTGDIGSGKSTLVDAITTLLIPSNKITYNKAAGADKKERSLKSYVRGFYKATRIEETASSKPVALRTQNDLTVLLGVFRNEGYDQTVTLAQVLYMKDSDSTPQRFYCCHEGELRIATDFAGFGQDIALLKKRLKGQCVEIHESFPGYGAWYRRRFGIAHEQAMDLFLQTVSMKSVENLTQFVRDNMLSPGDSKDRVESLIHHFDDLSRAHESVLKAKRQKERLTPLVADCLKHTEISARTKNLEDCRDAIPTYYRNVTKDLLDKDIARLTEEFRVTEAEAKSLEGSVKTRSNDVKNIEEAINANGGSRIQELAKQIEALENERDARRKKHDKYAALIGTVGETSVNDGGKFAEQQSRLATVLGAARQDSNDCEDKIDELRPQKQTHSDTHKQISEEIESLKTRASNIPSALILLRAQICEQLRIKEGDIPFAGELIQIRHNEKADWEGAIERYMRGFASSMLVSDKHYENVARFVDEQNLRTRIAYYHVKPDSRPESISLAPNAMKHKLEILPESEFYDWLDTRLDQIGNIACCDSLDEFRRSKRALTRNGQIKSAGEKHEKDDRRLLNDRSQFVLGWTNAEKIAALEYEKGKVEDAQEILASKFRHWTEKRDKLREKIEALAALGQYTDFVELDWQSCVNEIANKTDEKNQLEQSSNILKQLNVDLCLATKELEVTQAKLKEKSDETVRITTNRDSRQTSLASVKELLASELPVYSAFFARLDQYREECLPGRVSTLNNVDQHRDEITRWMNGQINAGATETKALLSKIVRAMADYNNMFASDTHDVDASIESADEYRRMLDELIMHGLPDYEAKFKLLLNENALREIANFRANLYKEQTSIEDRLEQINASLKDIEYNEGRFIRIEPYKTSDIQIRAFEDDLKRCTEDILSGPQDLQYSETKFLQVKAIIDRFRGIEGTADEDRRWTEKVTDVRNWFEFGASERYTLDDKEYQHYSDSSGKSGGQKEKLAITILAASLAYQFGLEWSNARSRTFRVIMIDEAFGRGSTDSTEFGMRLFEKLRLQVIVITPLQKVKVIEPFIHSVGFVVNEQDNDSRIRNLTIEDYRAEKDELMHNVVEVVDV
jgi:uncharacterized protein YPO0396